ncbi:flagellar hook-length control protein FliK [Oceanibacterium hippocampi]|nr:flagellar hook-length control protein FliK [Oceanibacterium hippocampi]
MNVDAIFKPAPKPTQAAGDAFRRDDPAFARELVERREKLERPAPERSTRRAEDSASRDSGRAQAAETSETTGQARTETASVDESTVDGQSDAESGSDSEASGREQQDNDAQAAESASPDGNGAAADGRAAAIAVSITVGAAHFAQATAEAGASNAQSAVSAAAALEKTGAKQGIAANPAATAPASTDASGRTEPGMAAAASDGKVASTPAATQTTNDGGSQTAANATGGATATSGKTDPAPAASASASAQGTATQVEGAPSAAAAATAAAATASTTATGPGAKAAASKTGTGASTALLPMQSALPANEAATEFAVRQATGSRRGGEGQSLRGENSNAATPMSVAPQGMETALARVAGSPASNAGQKATQPSAEQNGNGNAANAVAAAQAAVPAAAQLAATTPQGAEVAIHGLHQAGAAGPDQSQAAMASAPRHMPPPPAAQQLAVSISQAVHDGKDRIRIQLHPAELGRVDIKLELSHDGRVSAVIAADRPETLDLLQRDARALERALSDAGLKADSNSLSFASNGDNARRFAELAGDDKGLVDGDDIDAADEVQSLAAARAHRGNPMSALDIQV